VQLSLLRRIERYMQITGIRPAAFGRMAARDPVLVFDLRRGRKLRPLTAARLAAFLDKIEHELGEKICRRR
jgi:hypothetical protein